MGDTVEMVESELTRGSLLSREALLRPKPGYPHQGCPVLSSQRQIQNNFHYYIQPTQPTAPKVVTRSAVHTFVPSKIGQNLSKTTLCILQTANKPETEAGH